MKDQRSETRGRETPSVSTESFAVERQHSGTEDGSLWYVITASGARASGNGWLHREDAEDESHEWNSDPRS